MHIGETATNGDTVIYGYDNLPRGVAHSRDVARMWASSPDLVMALQTIADIAEGKMPGRGMKSIAKLARAAERSAQEESESDAVERDSVGLGVEGAKAGESRGVKAMKFAQTFVAAQADD